ncbi:hypothetical protein [Lactobacillus sp. PV034]|uniref:hypothetical protein n=1 Tax=Lactobacillus sp. PV034 TaxID=2594495 RepID=UPI00223F57F7|nr:hypothetical protein [Lactobacillus sp. PV034]QNQ80394.1 hypothetical protein FP432_01910 [Lactobacillus sp. PV034]
MLSSSSLLKYMWCKKNKTVNLLLLMQFIIAIIGAIWSVCANSKFTFWQKWSQGIAMVGITTPFVIIIYLFLSIYRNEKINSSQSWQLLPISSTKLYLINLFTAILNGLYLVLGQILMALVVIIPLIFDEKFRRGTGIIWHKIWSDTTTLFKDDLSIFILSILLILLFAIAIYLFVTTINFVSTLLLEQFSKNNTKFLRFFLVIILVVIAFIMGLYIIDLLSNGNFFSSTGWIEGCQANFVMLIIDAIFLSINLWLFHNYHEGR